MDFARYHLPGKMDFSSPFQGEHAASLDSVFVITLQVFAGWSEGKSQP